jgi:hypothetical protein
MSLEECLIRRGFAACLLTLGSLAVFGCGSKGAVSLSARIENATVLAPTPGVLGAALGGEFDLVLDLGPSAPRATSVQPGTFSLKNDQGPLLDSISASASESVPFEVAVGQSKTVHFMFSSVSVDASTRAAVCAADVWYTGTVSDTLSDNKPTLASSNKFTPSCP